MRTNVTFDSVGIKLAGALYAPDTAPKLKAGASQ
jgi:hypothetical protein